jgi:uncharacterized protein involved in cysteine biosynthesis
MLTPLLRSLEQITDPVFLGVVLHSVVWSVLAFVLLTLGVSYELHHLLAGHGWWSWLAGFFGAFGTAVASLWLFLPLATVIASLFVARISNAVEQRWYPGVLPGKPANIAQQMQDAIVLGLRVLAMQIVALIVSLIPPYLPGLIFGWAIASWAVGRGMFVPVAMMRMDRPTALALYRRRRFDVLVQGALMTAASLVPVLNLLVPVLGAAMMVHVLHEAMADAGMDVRRVVPPGSSVLGQPGQRPVS